MATPPVTPNNLFAALPAALSAGLFTKARPVRLKADQWLFLAGDPGDGCYLVDGGLLKATVGSPTGGERILAVLGGLLLPGEQVGTRARG